jgi:hypothetical protein
MQRTKSCIRSLCNTIAVDDCTPHYLSDIKISISLLDCVLYQCKDCLPLACHQPYFFTLIAHTNKLTTKIKVHDP